MDNERVCWPARFNEGGVMLVGIWIGLAAFVLAIGVGRLSRLLDLTPASREDVQYFTLGILALMTGVGASIAIAIALANHIINGPSLNGVFAGVAAFLIGLGLLDRLHWLLHRRSGHRSFSER